MEMADSVELGCNKLDFEETELRLGLTYGGGGGEKSNLTNGKRAFDDTVDLKLNLSSMKETDNNINNNSDLKEKKNHTIISNDAVLKPPAKAQVVGWPPVRFFRKSAMAAVHEKSRLAESFVKVSVDGAPYLRKVDLNLYKSYQQLYHALAYMFGSTTTGMMDFTESKVMDLLSGSEYVPTYEDKDGDWMLVGDVPWEMFVESCNRLRIMKGTDAKGFASGNKGHGKEQ